MNIDINTWYKPSTIAELKLIKSSRGECSRQFVLREIKAGKLPAKNVGKGKTPYYVVKGSDLLIYSNQNKIV